MPTPRKKWYEKYPYNPTLKDLDPDEVEISMQAYDVFCQEAGEEEEPQPITGFVRTKNSKDDEEGLKFDTPDIIFDEPYKILFEPHRFKVFYGGRASAKSWACGRALILKGAQEKHRILCAREIQTTISDSVFALLVDQIKLLGLQDFYQTTRNTIRGINGTEFIFKGLRYNIQEIKSTEGVDICWVEEAQSVSSESWDILIPTIRVEDSEIWVTFNPDEEQDPVYQRFVVNPEPDTVSVWVNWRDNSFITNTLIKEMLYLKKVDYERYLHVWEGHPKSLSNAVIFKGKYTVDAFESPEKDTIYYYGADWGFAEDPTVLIRCFIKGPVLYIDYEAYGVGIDVDNEMKQLFLSVPGSKNWPIYADSSRPETISYMKKTFGFNIKSAAKWSGSVEDGISFLRSFEKIVIHQRCKHMIEEAKFYKYKVDLKTGDVLPVIVDKDNHCWDALRYALGKRIQVSKYNSGGIILGFDGEEK